ncbi:MAG: transposase family protein [Nostoc sp.]|uniref:transposase family protein n=1 Tax=Nostoc sp. TaxID=1180 RepID=UPI002FFC462C
MKANLLEALTQVQDFRAARGQRYPLWLLLLVVIMGTMSGCLGYRALEDGSSSAS